MTLSLVACSHVCVRIILTFTCGDFTTSHTDNNIIHYRCSCSCC